MEVIIDYCNDEPTGIPKNDRYVTPSRGQIMIQKKHILDVLSKVEGCK